MDGGGEACGGGGGKKPAAEIGAHQAMTFSLSALARSSLMRSVLGSIFFKISWRLRARVFTELELHCDSCAWV